MLAESVTEWTENWKRQGLQEGRREGLQVGRQEGLQEGRQEGRQIGRHEGESTLLERLLAKRFGPLDDDIRARLKAASSEQLETWAERLLDAANLSDVFGNA